MTSRPTSPAVRFVDPARERVGDDDVAGAARLITAHQERVTRLVTRLLGWRSDIDDVVQDVFVSAIEALPRFRGDADLSTWLFRIAVNRCRGERRRWLRLRFWTGGDLVAVQHRQDAGPSDRPRDAAAVLVASETGAAVRAAVQALPSRDREVIVLRYLEGLSIAAIAEIVGARLNAVEARLSRARRKLAGPLKELLES